MVSGYNSSKEAARAFFGAEMVEVGISAHCRRDGQGGNLGAVTASPRPLLWVLTATARTYRPRGYAHKEWRVRELR